MSETIDYKKLVSIIFKQMNIYRDDPRALVPILQARLNKYDDKKFIPTGDPNIVVLTEEGGKAVQELIDSLKFEAKYPKFTWSFDLHRAANHKANQISSESRGRGNEVTEDV